MLAGVYEKASSKFIGKSIDVAFASRQQRGEGLALGPAQIFEFSEVESSERLQQRHRIVDRPESQPCADLLQMIAERRQ